MADDPHVLLDFELDSTTIRIADEWLTLDDGTVYKGWLRDYTDLRRTLGTILDPVLVAPSMQLVIDNTNDQMRDLLDTHVFANRDVVIKFGTGEAAAAYSEVFTGIVHFSGGIQWDEKYVYITLDVAFTADDLNIPLTKFTTGAYPNLEDDALNQPIPIVYGSWLSSDGGGERVKCYQIDSTVGTGGQFKISVRNLKQLASVHKNGASVSFSSTDLPNAEFVLDVAYDPDVDEITAHVQGATDDGTASGNLIQTLPDLAEDILTTYMGVAAGKVDSTAFSGWEANLTADDYGRRVIDTEIMASRAVVDCLIDGFADMTIVGGKYTPVYRIVDVSGSIPTYYDFDIVDGPEIKEFRAKQDPERGFANEIVGEYRKNPVSGDFEGDYKVDDDASIETYKTRRRRRLTLNWLYNQTGAEARTQRELHVFATEGEAGVVTLKEVAISKGPTDQFRLVYNKYDLGDEIGTPFQIREAVTGLKRKRVKVTAWNILQLSPGRWTEDAAPTWSSATAWQRQIQGFWTDANGFADPAGTDVTSKRSKWF